MQEIEIKVIGIDFPLLKERLKEAGARFDTVEEQTNIRIDSSTHPISEDAYLRIRIVEEEGRVTSREFTYKERQPSASARVNEETTVLIDDEIALQKLLAKMGYDQAKASYKRRERYLLEDFRFEFDCWDKKTLSYPYMEIEAPSEERLQEMLKKLEIAPSHCSTKSIRELQKEDRGKH